MELFGAQVLRIFTMWVISTDTRNVADTNVTGTAEERKYRYIYIQYARYVSKIASASLSPYKSTSPRQKSTHRRIIIRRRKGLKLAGGEEESKWLAEYIFSGQ